MSIWNIDSISKLSEQKTLLRVVKYHESVDIAPGELYFIIPSTNRTFVDWGEAYEIPVSAIRSARRPGQTPFFSDGFNFNRREDVKNDLLKFLNDNILASEQATVDDIDRDVFQPLGRADSTSWIWAKIHVHNVGQGDTIVLELPGDQIWIIDCYLRSQRRRDEFNNWLTSFFPGRTINKVIATHLHFDHIKSIPNLLSNQRYSIQEVLIPDSLKHTTASSRRTLHFAGNKLKTGITTLTYYFGELTVTIAQTSSIPALSERVVTSRDPNHHSLAIILRTQNSTAFLGADIPGDFCHEILSNVLTQQPPFELDYYKVSHHGSTSGYDKNFFNDYPSRHSIISCSNKNRYQHPHCPPVGHFHGSITLTFNGGQRCYTYALQ